MKPYVLECRLIDYPGEWVSPNTTGRFPRFQHCKNAIKMGKSRKASRDFFAFRVRDVTTDKVIWSSDEVTP